MNTKMKILVTIVLLKFILLFNNLWPILVIILVVHYLIKIVENLSFYFNNKDRNNKTKE